MNLGKKLHPISWAALSVAALLHLFVFAVSLSLLPRYLVLCFIAFVLALAIACADRFLFESVDAT